MGDVSNQNNLDPAEIAKFDAWAGQWWDTGGGFGLLHKINPHRLDFIDARIGLEGKNVLDVGCGGGILSEGLAKRGARVTGIDMAAAPLAVARRHCLESGLEINYQQATAEALALESAAAFDVVTCLELLEHVPDPPSVVKACARLVKPGGGVFFSTMNRTVRAWLLAIIGAEYILGLIARGTHRYKMLIKPDELSAWCASAGLCGVEQCGVVYNPFFRTFRLAPGDLSINYMVYCRRE